MRALSPAALSALAFVMTGCAGPYSSPTVSAKNAGTAGVANVKALAREHYYDGLAIVRVQDNYVVQLADPDAEKPELARKIQRAQRTLPAEFAGLAGVVPTGRLTETSMALR